MHTIRFRYILTAEHFTPCQHNEDGVCQHSRNFIDPFWKCGRGVKVIQTILTSKIIHCGFPSFHFNFLHAPRKGGATSFLCTFLYENLTKMLTPRKKGGLAFLDATCLLGSWRTFTYTLQFLAHKYTHIPSLQFWYTLVHGAFFNGPLTNFLTSASRQILVASLKTFSLFRLYSTNDENFCA